VAVAIDGRYHGERTKAGRGAEEYNEAIARAWRGGSEHPFYYDTVWDVIRLVDYLKTRKDIDPKRIGLIGISKGGIETYLAAAVDKRIAVAVPVIGVQSFHWALEHDAWHSRISTIQIADAAAKESQSPRWGFRKILRPRRARYHAEFDGPAMLPLIAPRPLPVINGDWTTTRHCRA
jgi:dienelactone hydrolase